MDWHLLNELVGIQTALNDLSRLLECAIESVDNNHTPLHSMSVKVPMSLVMPFHSLLHNLQRNLQHLGSITPDSDNQPALLPSLTARQDGVIEQRLYARRAAEDDIGSAHLILKQPRKFPVPGGQNPKVSIRPALKRFLLRRDGMKAFEKLPASLGEAVVDDVHVADGAAAQHEGKADMPISLLARAKDGDGVDLVSSDEQAGRGEGSSEGG